MTPQKKHHEKRQHIVTKTCKNTLTHKNCIVSSKMVMIHDDPMDCVRFSSWKPKNLLRFFSSAVSPEALTLAQFSVCMLNQFTVSSANRRAPEVVARIGVDKYRCRICQGRSVAKPSVCRTPTILKSNAFVFRFLVTFQQFFNIDQIPWHCKSSLATSPHADFDSAAIMECLVACSAICSCLRACISMLFLCQDVMSGEDPCRGDTFRDTADAVRTPRMLWPSGSDAWRVFQW